MCKKQNWVENTYILYYLHILYIFITLNLVLWSFFSCWSHTHFILLFYVINNDVLIAQTNKQMSSFSGASSVFVWILFPCRLPPFISLYSVLMCFKRLKPLESKQKQHPLLIFIEQTLIHWDCVVWFDEQITKRLSPQFDSNITNSCLIVSLWIF